MKSEYDELAATLTKARLQHKHNLIGLPHLRGYNSERMWR
jgi:hypothetical protein